MTLCGSGDDVLGQAQPFGRVVDRGRSARAAPRAAGGVAGFRAAASRTSASWSRSSAPSPLGSSQRLASHARGGRWACWLVDAVASYQLVVKVRQESFQVWLRQVIEYTDFPLNEITLYFADGVLMLPSEY